MADTPTPESKPSRRGFAGMDAAKQREIAAKGGRAAHRSGNAHEFDSEEARAAGRAGGRARALNRTRNSEERSSEEAASASSRAEWSESASTQREQGTRINRPEDSTPSPRPSTH